MESVVFDSNVLVAYLLDSDRFHEQGLEVIGALERGDFEFHLPTIVPLEVVAVISREVTRNRAGLLTAWKQTFLDWEQSAKMTLYPLDRDRMETVIPVAERVHLKVADSIVASLSEELQIPLKTFDNEIIDRFPLASP